MMTDRGGRADTICFDYYRTLVDIDDPFEHLKSWIFAYIIEHEFPVEPSRFYSRFIRYRALYSSGPFILGIDILRNSLKLACEKLNIPDFSEPFGSMAEELFRSPKPFPDAKEVVRQLRDKYSVGVLSNADNYIIHPSIEEHDFEFDFVITSDDAKANKPAPQIYEYALEKLFKTNKNVIMVGDSQTEDVWGANQCGISAIWLNRSRQDLKQGIDEPLFIAESLTEVLEYFQKIYEG